VVRFLAAAGRDGSRSGPGGVMLLFLGIWNLLTLEYDKL
jgi:hypothetical protein